MTQPPRGTGGYTPATNSTADDVQGLDNGGFGEPRLTGTPKTGSAASAGSATKSAGTNGSARAAASRPAAAPLSGKPGLSKPPVPPASVAAAMAAGAGATSTAGGTPAAKATPRTAARARGPRRARLQLRHIDPWTVLKFSCVWAVASFFVWLIAVALLYGVLTGAGVVGSINDTVTKINPGSGAPITAWRVLIWSSVIGVLNVILFIALATIGSVVYNLCADLVGGVEMTLSERET